MSTTDQTSFRRLIVAIFALVAAAALAGCSSSGSPAGGTSEGSGSIAAHRVPVIRIGAGDDGRTITVSVGQTIKLRLTSTYWQVAKGAPGTVLRTDARQTRPTRSPRCVAGQGCGVASATYTALHPGRAVIAAARQSCGEALRCSPAQSRYRVQLVVKQ